MSNDRGRETSFENCSQCRNWCPTGLESEGHENVLNFLSLEPWAGNHAGNTGRGGWVGFTSVYVLLL